MRLATIVIILALSLRAADQPQAMTATIAINTAESSIVNLGSCIPAAIITPAAWTAASIMVTASVDGANFFTVYDRFGAKEIVSADVSRWIVLSPSDTWSYRHLILRSTDATGTDVNQVATRTLIVVCRK